MTVCTCRGRLMSMMTKGRLIRCVVCKRSRAHYAKQKCEACWRRDYQRLLYWKKKAAEEGGEAREIYDDLKREA